MSRKKPDNTNIMDTYSLKAARVNVNMSRAEVERKTGVSVAMLSRYENGVSEPSGRVVQKLCLLYGIGIDKIRFEDKPKNGSRRKQDERVADGKGRQTLDS